MGRGGAILPAAQGLHADRAAQGTRLLPVEPQAQALLTEHVLGTQALSPAAAATPRVWGVNPSLPKLMFITLVFNNSSRKKHS